jgi:hypothetical protein
MGSTLQQRADRIRVALQRRNEAEAVIAEGLRLAKEELGTRAWLAWTAKEFGWGRSTSYRHLDPKQMQKHREQEAERYEDEVSNLETEDDDEEPGEHTKDDWRSKYVIQRAADTDERLKLAVEMIREGYRVLAKKNHPDLGGDSAAMAKLSEARDWVLNFVVNPPLLVLRA